LPEDGGNICDTPIPNYEYLGNNGSSSYYISENIMSWSQAEQSANINGGYLASISDQAENDFIQSLISEVVWIGMNDLDDEGEIVWENGEDFVFDNQESNCSWCPGNTADNDYGVIYNWNGKWDFTSIFVLKKAILEIPCQSSSTDSNTSAYIQAPTIKLHKAYPNPTNGFIKFQFRGNKELYTDFEVYDLTGQLVKTIPFQMYNGRNEVRVDARSWQDGIYFTRIAGVRQSEFKFVVASGF